MALFPDEQGGLTIELLANKARYDESTLVGHARRLTQMVQQYADNPQLRCGDADVRKNTIGWRRLTILA